MSISSIFTTSFPSVTLGIPIATVCPLSTADAHIAEAFIPISFSPTSTPTNILTTSIISASATLPNGSITTFSSLTSGEAATPSSVSEPAIFTVLPDGTSAIQIDGGDGTLLGRIIIGTDDCQTLYKPTVTAICSTVVSPMGLPEVTVTDCDQYITFSSETLFSCAPTPTVVPLPAPAPVGSGSVSASGGRGAVLTRTVGDSVTTRSFTANSSSFTQDLGISGVSTATTDQDPNDMAPTALSQYYPLSEDLSNPSTSISYPTPLSDSTSTSNSTPSQALSPITTRFPLSPNNNDVASKPLLRRPRRYLIYSTAPTDDVPMSLPRHLLPGSQPRVQQRPILVHKGEAVVTGTMSVPPTYSTSAGERIGGGDGGGDGDGADVSVSVSLTATATATAKKFSDVVRALFYRRQVDGTDGVDAAGLNATLLNTTDAASNPGMGSNTGTDIEGDGELNATVTALNVSMPLSPMFVSISPTTDGGGVDSGVVATTTAMAPDVSGLSLGSDMSLSTTGIDSVSITSMSLLAMGTDTATDVDTDTDVPLSTMNTDTTTIATPTADTNTDADISISTTPTMNNNINTETSTNTSLSLANKLVALSPPQPTKYYAAPWHQFLNLTGIPTNIKGITCRGGLEPVGSCITPDTDGDTESCECDVEDEIWSVWSETRTRVGTTSVSFSGGVVVGGVTTVVVVQQVLTTTATDIVGRVARRVVTNSASASGSGSMTVTGDGEETVYATLTSYPSITMTLVPGDGDGMGGPANSTGVGVDAGVSSSTFGPAMEVGAAMPQNGPSSISMPTGSDVSISMPISTSIAPSISYPTGISTSETEDLFSSVSMPTTSFAEETGAGPDTMIDGTVLVTSVVATETVTVLGGDSPGGFGPSPTGAVGSFELSASGDSMSSEGMEEMAASPTVPAAVGKRDAWPTDVWIVDADVVAGEGETETEAEVDG